MRRRTARRLSPRTSEPGRAPARRLLIAAFSVAGLAPSAERMQLRVPGPGICPVVRTGCIVAGLARRTGCKGLSNGCLASRTRPRQSTLNIERRTRALPGHSARKDRVSKADMLGRSAHGKLWVVSGPSALRLADARDQGEPIARNRCHYCFWLFLPGAGRWRKEC